jgi:hypothetical protein
MCLNASLVACPVQWNFTKKGECPLRWILHRKLLNIDLAISVHQLKLAILNLRPICDYLNIKINRKISNNVSCKSNGVAKRSTAFLSKFSWAILYNSSSFEVGKLIEINGSLSSNWPKIKEIKIIYNI